VPVRFGSVRFGLCNVVTEWWYGQFTSGVGWHCTALRASLTHHRHGLRHGRVAKLEHFADRIARHFPAVAAHIEIALAAVVLGARRAADIAEVLAGGLTLRIYMITMVAIQPTRV
jgi:hypothetical protein